MAANLVVSNVSKSFAGLKAVSEISLEAHAGAITAVIGPNGAGKTTLFNCLTGVLRADRSESRLERLGDGGSLPLFGRTPSEICRLGIARTFQQVRLFDSLAVVDNVMLGALHRSGLGWAGAVADRLLLGRRRHRALRAEAERLLERVGLSAQRHDLAGNLDHGSRRRLEIARALASQPDVLLLDEPAAGMNRVETDGLMEFLTELRGEGLAILLIEHDMKMIMGISDRVHVMDHGVMLAAGEPQAVAHDPAVVEAYLGSAYAQAGDPHAHG